MAGIYKGVATWYGAAIVGGVLIVLMEWGRRKAGPTKSDVKRAAARYRAHYGRHAIDVIGEHIFAASFASDSRHRRFLKRVRAELSATSVTDEDRARDRALKVPPDTSKTAKIDAVSYGLRREIEPTAGDW